MIRSLHTLLARCVDSCIRELSSKVDKMKFVSTQKLSLKQNHLLKFQLQLLAIVSLSHLCSSQIVSHELRRLAVSTNQFGIDALKALDRIEPPDKVIVFCPVCLSSSLTMIMMGSSRYPVVSSLRHALYVWSMKPQEINRGFKDIFEHIGLNQQQASTKMHQTLSNARNLIKRDISDELNEVQRKRRQTNRMVRQDNLDLGDDVYKRQMSLPNLMRIREYMDRSMKYSEPWWTAVGRKSDLTSKETVENRATVEFGNGHKQEQSLTNQTESIKLDSRDAGDLSQMSSISSIYLQRGLNMNYNYNLLLRQYYKTVIHPVDFIRNGEETRQHINSLVASNTEGKIKDLVKPGTFTATRNPRIMIISTFHFRGTLDIQMRNADSQTNRTRKRTARVNQPLTEDTNREKLANQQQARNQPFIETEETLLKYGTFANLDCSMIEIPFNNRLVSLIILMPNQINSTDILLTKLSAQVLSDMINTLTVKKISIEIPVIKFDRGPVNVDGVLRELGLSSVFFADKPQSTETGLNKWMHPSDIIHETSIDIGTINPKWSQTEDRLKVGAHDSRSGRRQDRQASSQRKHLKLDKPFFYFVFDSINGLVLTMGRIRQ